MLISCPECSHNVSDRAIMCPECGYPIASEINTFSTPQVKKSPKPRKKHQKLPNGFGSIKKLTGNRSKPYAAYPPTKEFTLNGSPVTQPAIGYFKNWHEAYEALSSYNKSPYNIKDRDITFAELYNDFYTYKFIKNKKKVYSRSTRDASNAAFKNCSKLHNMRFKDIRKKDLQDIIDNCPLKHASLELIVSLFNQMYSYARENDIIDKDYSEFVHINIAEDDEQGEPFSESELSLLWNNKDDDNVKIILIMIYSGFRIKAYESMEINLKEQYFRGGVKTNAGKNRVVPIHPDILDYVKEFDVSKFKSCYFRNKCFYPTLNNLGILYTQSGKKHTPHDCRHTFSWLCDKYNVNDFAKHLLMGHSFGNDIERSVYGHRTIDELRIEIYKMKTPISKDLNK